MHTMFACLNRKALNAKVEVEQARVTKAVHRDELSKKQRPSRGEKKSVRFADKEAIILGGNDEKNRTVKRSSGGGGEEERAGIRVKVKMTKEEAARLLSKCKEGGVLEFKDVARELVSIPVGRVSVVSSNCTNMNDP